MNPVRKGALAEYKAMAWLLEQGYEVFKNISPEGPFDMVALGPEGPIFIDVKDIASRSKHARSPSLKFSPTASKYEGLNRKLLYVSGEQVSWSANSITDDETYRQIKAYLSKTS